MISLQKAKDGIKERQKRLDEINKEIPKVSSIVRSPTLIYDQAVKAEKDARLAYEKALLKGESVSELKKRADEAMAERLQCDSRIEAARVIWKEYQEEVDILKAELVALEQVVNFYPVYMFIEKTYELEAQKFAKVCKELEELSVKHGFELISSNINTVRGFTFDDFGNVKIATLFRERQTLPCSEQM